MRALIVAGLFGLAACAGHSGSAPEPQTAWLDMTGADVAKWDSLSKTYAVGPQPRNMLLPPLPPPPGVRGSSFEMVLTVDERGVVTRVSMTPLKDSEYARNFARAWRGMPFTPARTRDGHPTKGYYRFRYDF